MERVSAALASSVLVAALAACGPGERPPVATEEALDETAGAATLLPAPPRPKAPRVCEPGASRSCLLTYIEGNRKNCFPSTQFCKANGYGWLPCGERAEPPLPPPAEEDEEEAPEDDAAPEVD